MLVQSTILIALWVIMLKYAEKKNKELKFHKDVISDYINSSRQLQLGFVFLTIGLGIFGYLTKDIHSLAQNCFYQGQFGQFLVQQTRSDYFKDTTDTSKDWLHILGQGLAFQVTTLGTLLISYGNSDFLFGLAVSIPLYSLLGFIYRMDNGDKERIVQYPLILWFLINAGQYLLDKQSYTIFL